MQKKASKRLPPLDLIRGFEAAARHLSFTKAAEELFLTQSAVSRQVQGLEEHLGVPLFQRKHRALLLTDEGQVLHRTVAAVLRDLRGAIDQVTQGRSARMVNVTTMVTFASLWLVPRLPKFRALHPGIDVRISANNEVIDLERQRIDVAVRYIAPEKAPRGAQRLFGEDIMPVCSPALLRRAATPLKKPADLRHHVLLQMDDAPAVS
ncbi:MAG TPA: LysR family transcriptional regulator, partial [Solimonas sp.]|nr:LysR family transcriptional regulator [Solimonas sp.]